MLPRYFHLCRYKFSKVRDQWKRVGAVSYFKCTQRGCRSRAMTARMALDDPPQEIVWHKVFCNTSSEWTTAKNKACEERNNPHVPK
jgi:hypothetical protein